MARTGDTFTAAQAAQVLGISERRVRQLVTEGKLPGARGDDNVVRIPQQAVNEERKRRRGSGGAAKAAATRGGSKARQTKTQQVDVDDLAEKVASSIGKRLEGQLEITRQAESHLRSELDEERANRTQAEARLGTTQVELAEARARLDEANRRISELEGQLQQAQQKRGLFRRG
jgi:excisionase family DNA binding protein